MGETRVRSDDGQMCKNIVGYDANALYLWSLSYVRPYLRRRESSGFKAEAYTRHAAMYDWMDYLSSVRGITIDHKLNAGREVVLGPNFVDGWHGDSKTCFEFLGCYWHFHKSHITARSPKERKELEERHGRTQVRLKYLESLGYKVETIWECDYKNLLESDPVMKKFVENRRPVFFKNNGRRTQFVERDLLDAVRLDIWRVGG